MPRKVDAPVPQDDLTTTLEQVALADVRPHPRNYQDHPEPEILHLMASLRTHGVYRNVVIARDGTLLAGHGVVEAARRLGMTHLPMKRQDYGADEPRALQLLAGDNEIAREAVKNEEALVALLQELAQDDPLALLGTGFDEATLKALADAQGLGNGTGDAGRDVEPQIDRAEELRDEWGVEVGQLWVLGKHRVICGDCTDKAAVELLMQGEQATLVVTDPPYGVSYADKNAFLNTIGRANSIEKPIVNDHMSKVQMQALWKAAFTVMAEVMAPGGVVYCFMPQGGDQMMMMMMMMMEGAGIEPRHELIWVKNNHVLGRVDYAYKHEPILYAWKAGGHKFYGDFQTSILEYTKPQKSDLHPTTKPVALVEKLVDNSSRSGELIYDGFLGAGTTLIACENLGRTCYGCEIDPGYVAVCLQRYYDLSGILPVLIP